ncbi:MAG: cytochrome C oxidase subunit IV family protein [Planctomycetaceae bacterium]|nr:cytochrome C oxidase subunit IV family protein [Planctomycetaceae bacterium]
MHDSHPSPPAGAGHEHDSHHAYAEHAPHVNYLFIFILLCICTILSAVFDLLPSKRVVTVLVLAVAVAKAQFVMRYFMHLKFEGKWKYVLLLPTAILACGLPLALAPDIGLHYYPPAIPQLQYESGARGEGAAHAAEHADEAHPEGEHPDAEATAPAHE